jgi:hypothetical protein
MQWNNIYILVNVITAITVYWPSTNHIFGSKIVFCMLVYIVFTNLLNKNGLEKELGRAELQRMFHNVTARLEDKIDIKL